MYVNYSNNCLRQCSLRYETFEPKHFGKIKMLALLLKFKNNLWLLIVILCRFPCRIGTCTTPIEVSLSLLYANGIIPGGLVKALLYPGAVVKAIYKNNTIPSYDKLLKIYKFTNMKQSPVTHDLQNLEVGYQFMLLLWARVELVRTRGLIEFLLSENYTVQIGYINCWMNYGLRVVLL